MEQGYKNLHFLILILSIFIIACIQAAPDKQNINESDEFAQKQAITEFNTCLLNSNVLGSFIQQMQEFFTVIFRYLPENMKTLASNFMNKIASEFVNFEMNIVEGMIDMAHMAENMINAFIRMIPLITSIMTMLSSN
ncbi:uncharacterized protein LOC105429345 [Pogonomyrmex barbatus]|uniref:Uncharacterized protein LOC105429345 n=1 Tax=Pogonomyrmex barbatus TaxID=144034 RepID=A0A6I9WDV1_9HYME|nr:uncharacterized protein LOC105429345 [Pogonomyrmex barbatus]